MPAKGRASFPSPPDLPAKFEPAPDTLGSGDAWEAVEADETVAAAERLADVQLRETVWSRAQFLGRRFTGLTCQDVRFVQCDFAGASLLDARLDRVTFEACRMSGVVLAGGTLQDVHLVECVADLADLRMARLRRSAAEGCSLREADFYGGDLRDVRLTGCDLSAANFDTAHAERLDLRGSTLDGLRGAPSLATAQIGAEQVIPLGAALLDALGFRIG